MEPLDGSSPMEGGDGAVTNAGDGGIVIVPGYDGGIVGVTCSPGETTTITGTVYYPAATNPLYGRLGLRSGRPPPRAPDGRHLLVRRRLPREPDRDRDDRRGGKVHADERPQSDRGPARPPDRKVAHPDHPGEHPLHCHSPPRQNHSPSRGNHTAGDIPQIAISTGSADSLECLLLRVGLDPAEYVGGAGGPGHLHIFQGEERNGHLWHRRSAEHGALRGPAELGVSSWDSQADLSERTTWSFSPAKERRRRR